MGSIDKGIGILTRQIDEKGEDVLERSDPLGKCLIEYPPKENGEGSVSHGLLITRESNGITLYVITQESNKFHIRGHEKVSSRETGKVTIPIPQETQLTYDTRCRIKVSGILPESTPSPEEEKMEKIRHAIIDYKRANPKKFK
jgi:hypothetical protein